MFCICNENISHGSYMQGGFPCFTISSLKLKKLGDGEGSSDGRGTSGLWVKCILTWRGQHTTESSVFWSSFLNGHQMDTALWEHHWECPYFTSLAVCACVCMHACMRVHVCACVCVLEGLPWWLLQFQPRQRPRTQQPPEMRCFLFLLPKEYKQTGGTRQIRSPASFQPSQEDHLGCSAFSRLSFIVAESVGPRSAQNHGNHCSHSAEAEGPQ